MYAIVLMVKGQWKGLFYIILSHRSWNGRRCRSRQILGGGKDFCPKNVWATFVCEHFLKQTFCLDNLQPGLHVILPTTLGTIFSKIQPRWAPLLPRF